MNEKLSISVVKVCSDIISGNLDFVSGSRMIRILYLSADEEDKDLYLPIIGFESETDDYPLGSRRRLFATTELEKMDQSILEYENRSRDMFKKVCYDLIRRYSC